MKNRSAFAALAFFCAQVAYACSPGQNFDVYFAQNSSVVSASELLRLGNWTADQRVKYPRQEIFQIDGRADEREDHAPSLAKARLQAVVAILDILHFNQVPMNEHHGVYRSGDVENGRRVEISILPACPHQCCALPNHNGEGNGLPMP